MTKKQDIVAKVFDKQGRMIGFGKNSYSKTHPLQAKYAKQTGQPEKQYLHAEVEAIIKSLKNGVPYSIHVERFNKYGEPVLAQPCPICMLAIKQAGIKKVTFTI
jgi:tRNA(Arg) A34 adenosine deaminase TadA